METKIVLMRDFERLGKRGDVIRVALGYARNYLFPKKIAAPATEKYVRMLEVMKNREEAAFRRAEDTVRKLAERLDQVSCTIPMQAGDDGKLFGSVTTQQIEESLQHAGFDVDRKKIIIHEPIRELGVYSVEVKIHPEVSSSIKVWVVEK